MTMVMIVDEIDEAYSPGSRNRKDDDCDDDDGVCNDDERAVHPHVFLDKCQHLACNVVQVHDGSSCKQLMLL